MDRNGHHLFTLLASLRALQAGAILADRLGNTGAADYYRIQAGKISVRLRDFKDPDGIWRASISDTWEADDERAGGDGRAGWFMPLERSGLDCAVPVAAIHLGHSRGGLGEGGRVEDEPEDDLGPADPAIIQTLHAYIQSFGGLYRINDYKKWTEGWGVGRYAEDVYNGVGTSKGNPWYVCTSNNITSFRLSHSK